MKCTAVKLHGFVVSFAWTKYEKKNEFFFFLRGNPSGLGSMARRFMENIVVRSWSQFNIDD